MAHITKKRLHFLPGFYSSERIVPVQNVSSKAREVSQWGKTDAARLDNLSSMSASTWWKQNVGGGRADTGKSRSVEDTSYLGFFLPEIMILYNYSFPLGLRKKSFTLLGSFFLLCSLPFPIPFFVTAPLVFYINPPDLKHHADPSLALKIIR